MLSRSNNILEEIDIGCNVLIPIPQVDRGKGDPKNIILKNPVLQIVNLLLQHV
jgi:hypothetical protein